MSPGAAFETPVVEFLLDICSKFQDGVSIRHNRFERVYSERKRRQEARDI